MKNSEQFCNVAWALTHRAFTDIPLKPKQVVGCA